MEVDGGCPLAPAGDDPVIGSKMDGIYGMEEYQAKCKAENAARETAEATQQMSTTQSKAVPQPGQGPVAVGARSSKNTVALHEQYQALGLPQPSFNYSGSSDQGWTGELSFPGLDVDELQGIKLENMFPSKPEAKEALSERALPILNRLVEEGIVKKMTAETRARSSKYKVALHDKHQKIGIPQPFYECTGSTAQGWIATITFPLIEELKDTKLRTSYPTKSKQEALEAVSKMAFELVEDAEKEGKFATYAKVKGPAQMQALEKKEPGPNYTGQLLEFQRAINAPQPTYHDYKIGATLFACQVSIETPDSSSPQLFGSLDSPFPSKKASRQDAARHAVEHFKALGIWPTDSLDAGGIKKRKKAPAADDMTPTPLTPAKSSNTSPPTPPSSSSYAQRVASLAVALSLGTPEWRFTPNHLDRDFHTVACYFAGGGRHAGPIGEVRNVFGKKKAKEECARLTVEYLERVKEERIRFAEEMMGRGRGVREVEGKSGSVGGSGVGEEMDGDGDGDDESEFEDAVENLEGVAN